jgi:hypothetical protein
MEQRVVLASALVLGCVTAAGAGGFLATRHLATPPAAESTTTAAPPVREGAEVVDATVADIEPAPSASALPAPVTAGPKRPTSAEPVASSREPVSQASPRAARTDRTDRAAAASPASNRGGTAVNAPASRPGPESARQSAPVRTPPPASAPAADTGGFRDAWPAPATSPSRDASPADRNDSDVTTTAGSTLPSRPAIEEPTTPPAPVRRLETVTIPADAVIGVQLETTVTSAAAKVEDPVRARVTRDLLANGQVVVPAGARLLGNVTLVEEGGKVKERARLGVRFHTLVLVDGTEVRLPTETIYRDGESPAGRSAAKIGGAAVGGAILGAIVGGGKGAVIGAATGAGSGTGWAMAGDRRPAELRSGQSLTVRVSDSVSTQVER